MPEDAAIARLRAVHGERGAAWLSELPRRLDLLRARWGLVEFGPAFAGAHASFVAPVRNTEGAELAIKLVPREAWATEEAAALRHWAGRGAVRLMDVDAELGALLLERAIPGDDLAGLARADDRAATAAAAMVMVALREASGDPPAVLPDLEGWIETLRPVMASRTPVGLGDAWERATAVAAEILSDGDRTLLHGDLHHHNILTSERASWLVIDPKGVTGPREAEAAALLRNPRGYILAHADPIALLSDRIDILAERLGDDDRLLLLWGYVLAVLAAGWTFEDGEGDDEVRRWLACADLLNRLIRLRRIG